MIPLSIYLLLVIELALVSWGDIRTQKIPNFWSLLNIVFFIFFLFFLPEIYPFAWATFLYSAVFLAVGFVLFLLKIMGGGDSKFLFSFFLLIPVSLQSRALILLLLSTVLIGGFLLLTNIGKNHEKIVAAIKTGYIRGIKECFGTKFSFAPVILLAWLWLGWEIGLISF
ncbi:MAG: prepilin peptidase [Bacteriovoracia bacterium]